MDGEGEFLWTDGMKYFGQFSKGIISGHGVMEWPDGAKYEGYWKN